MPSRPSDKNRLDVSIISTPCAKANDCLVLGEVTFVTGVSQKYQRSPLTRAFLRASCCTFNRLQKDREFMMPGALNGLFESCGVHSSTSFSTRCWKFGLWNSVSTGITNWRMPRLLARGSNTWCSVCRWSAPPVAFECTASVYTVCFTFGAIP